MFTFHEVIELNYRSMITIADHLGWLKEKENNEKWTK